MRKIKSRKLMSESISVDELKRCRKVEKSEGASSNVRGLICPPPLVGIGLTHLPDWKGEPHCPPVPASLNSVERPRKKVGLDRSSRQKIVSKNLGCTIKISTKNSSNYLCVVNIWIQMKVFTIKHFLLQFDDSTLPLDHRKISGTNVYWLLCTEWKMTYSILIKIF